MKRTVITIAVMFVLGVVAHLSGSGSGLVLAGTLGGVTVTARMLDQYLLTAPDDVFLARRGGRWTAAVIAGVSGAVALFLLSKAEASDNWLVLVSQFVASLVCGAALEAILHADPRPTYAEWSEQKHSRILGK